MNRRFVCDKCSLCAEEGTGQVFHTSRDDQDFYLLAVEHDFFSPISYRESWCPKCARRVYTLASRGAEDSIDRLADTFEIFVNKNSGSRLQEAHAPNFDTEHVLEQYLLLTENRWRTWLVENANFSSPCTCGSHLGLDAFSWEDNAAQAHFECGGTFRWQGATRESMWIRFSRDEDWELASLNINLLDANGKLICSGEEAVSQLREALARLKAARADHDTGHASGSSRRTVETGRIERKAVASSAIIGIASTTVSGDQSIGRTQPEGGRHGAHSRSKLMASVAGIPFGRLVLLGTKRFAQHAGRAEDFGITKSARILAKIADDFQQNAKGSSFWKLDSGKVARDFFSSANGELAIARVSASDERILETFLNAVEHLHNSCKTDRVFRTEIHDAIGSSLFSRIFGYH